MLGYHERYHAWDLPDLTRHLAIGDIHGCYTALQSLIESIGLRDDDILITLGDYCNRGPNTAAVLDYLIHAHSRGILRPLRGNHEIIMLKARHDESELKKWLDVGGTTTLLSYAPFDGDAGRLTFPIRIGGSLKIICFPTLKPNHISLSTQMRIPTLRW